MDINLGKAGWDVFLFGIPLIAMLVFGFFRLDEVFTLRKKETHHPPKSAANSRPEKSMCSDPDGRPWD
jgi:hypothetical protein